MGVILVLFGYLTIAAFTAGYVYYHGVAAKARYRLFGPAEYVTLWLTCGLVGASWILFVPSLAVQAAHVLPRHLDARSRGWSFQGIGAARIRG